MPKKITPKEKTIAKNASPIYLRKVLFEEGFHFNAAIGKYTGITATSLSDFAEKLKVIPIESATFHVEREDFQNWIRTIVGDNSLANKIDRIKDGSSDTKGQQIQKIVEDRVMELKKIAGMSCP